MNKVTEIINNIEKIMVGKRKVVEKIVIALLTNGHVLIEDVPGVGKTQCVSALAKSVDGSFKRIQFTPDVMASDITGFTMYNPTTGVFEYKEGSANCNFLLADEINRASSKTQSSLLEVMEERQITVDGVTHKVPEPFMVLATQNPIESKGTNKLPEAQMDRFLFKLSIGYPSKEGEREILNRFAGENPLKNLNPVATTGEILKLQNQVEEVRVSEEIKDLIISIVSYTRNNVNLDLLKKSIELVIENNIPLKTVIREKDYKPYQTIDFNGKYEVKIEKKYDYLPNKEIRKIVEAQEAKTHFDISTFPLFNIRILESCEDKNLLVINIHHIIADAYSINIILENHFEKFKQYKNTINYLKEMKI